MLIVFKETDKSVQKYLSNISNVYYRFQDNSSHPNKRNSKQTFQV